MSLPQYNIDKPSWKNRRRVIFLSLLFCAFCVLYIMFQGNDTRINETIVLGCFALAGSIIGVYVAGSSWEDISIEKIKSNVVTNPVANKTTLKSQANVDES